MRAWMMGIVLAAAGAVLGGCGPQVSREELGEVVFELPKVAPSQPPASEPESGEEAPAAAAQTPNQ